MCKISNTLKLCTCSEIEIENAKHYWVFHRRIKGKKEIVIGLISIPGYLLIDQEINTFNKVLISTLINLPETFDKPIHAKRGDLLELSFLINNNDRITYGYKYSKGEWIEEQYHPLRWTWHHEPDQQGVIRSAFHEDDELS